MYRHEVLSDLEKYGPIFSTTSDRMKNLVAGFPELIKRSQAFHIPSSEVVDDFHESLMVPGAHLFAGDTGHVRLPYDLTWLDIGEINSRHLDERWKKTNNSWRRGYLLVNENRSLFQNESTKHADENRFALFIFSQFDGPLGHGKIWAPDPLGFFIRPTTSLNEPNLGIVLCAPPEVTGLSVDKMRNEAEYDLELVCCFLMLMSCKNIAYEKVWPPKRLNKKRQKKGKPQFLDYHVLKVKVGGRSAPLGGGGGGGDKRVHLCRGHFKTFTKDKPLLGHGVGTYWWQPQVRGNKKKGAVVKSYEVAQ